MRILYVSSFAYPTVVGGAEHTLHQLVSGMAARGHDVQVAALQSDKVQPLGPAPDYLRVFPVRNRYAPDGAEAHGGMDKLRWHLRDIYNPAAAADVASVVEAFRPDVISAHNLAGWSVAVWDAAARAGVPLVQVLHDFYLMCVAGSRSRDGQPCGVRCTRCRLFRGLHRLRSGGRAGPAAVVGISDHMLSVARAEGYFPGTPMHRIYNVETPLGLAPDQLPEPEGTIFGFVGRIAPHKGIETLLDAIDGADLPPDFELRIVGEGQPDYVARLQQRAAHLPVRFLGRQIQAVAFPQFRWTVVPSLSDEPLGRVVFESQGFGVPVIGSRRGGIPEMIREGQTGHLFEAGNVPELRRLIEACARAPRPAPRAEIAAQVATFFDTDRFLTQYEAAYTQALTGAPT